MFRGKNGVKKLTTRKVIIGNKDVHRLLTDYR
jgi:hypothetical protein